MRFRPCIDIHNGSVKQIVGGSLRDEGDRAQDNYISEHDAGFYADMYRRDGLAGGHIILLNRAGSEWYEKDLEQAGRALEAWPGGMQLGGGVTQENAEHFLDLGASHVIVTSYIFHGGEVDQKRLRALSQQIGRGRLVLDLSCRKYGDSYYIVTDRWQRRTREKLCAETMGSLSEYCDEFLVHAVDVEGKQMGIERSLISLLGEYAPCPVTYAGGISSLDDIGLIEQEGRGKLDFTVGSALDLFGGNIPYQDLVRYQKTAENVQPYSLPGRLYSDADTIVDNDVTK